MKRENVFRVGDKVWHPDFLWFEIERITPYAYFVILCDCGEKLWIDKRHIKSMSFTEYELNANHVRPFEDGDIIFYPQKVYDTDTFLIEIKGHLFYNEYQNHIFYNQTTGLENVERYLATEAQKQLLFERLEKEGKRWNPETKQLEELNEPKVGDDVIVWNEPRNQDASITKMTTHSPFIWDMVVRWDGTKEQFDRIRKGGNK